MSAAWAEFGRWLENEIERRDWKQADFARLGKLNPQNVSRWVHGVAQPSTQSCRIIARVLGVPVDDVLIRAGHRSDGSATASRSPLQELRKVVRELPLELPVYDHPVFAGKDEPAVQEYMYLSPETTMRPGWYGLPVRGTCMVPVLNPGDIVVVNPDAMPSPNDMVVFDLDDEVGMVKWFVKVRGEYFLQPEEGEPIPYDEARVRLAGVVMNTFGKKPHRGRR